MFIVKIFFYVMGLILWIDISYVWVYGVLNLVPSTIIVVCRHFSCIARLYLLIWSPPGPKPARAGGLFERVTTVLVH